jgi:predicted nucleic acid-binding protein
VIYLDSSVLVELYLGGEHAEEARAILDEPEAKVASWLLMVEVPVVLRRALPLPAHRQALAACLDRFDADLSDIALVDALTDVGLRVRSDARFAKCRALDAIHVCTALLMREWTGQAVRLSTFDARLGDLGGQVGVG